MIYLISCNILICIVSYHIVLYRIVSYCVHISICTNISLQTSHWLVWIAHVHFHATSTDCILYVTFAWLDCWGRHGTLTRSLGCTELASCISPKGWATIHFVTIDSCTTIRWLLPCYIYLFLLQLMSLSCHILSFLLVFFWNMMLHKNDPFCQKVWDHPVIPTSTIRWLHLLLNFAFNLLTEHPTQKLSDSSKSMFDLCHLIVVIPNYVGLCYPLKKIRTKVNIIAIVQRFEIQMSWKNCARYLWNYGNLTDGLF